MEQKEERQQILPWKAPSCKKHQWDGLRVTLVHYENLVTTGFECCAACPGCPGKVEKEKLDEQLVMRCSRVGAFGAYVTAQQAQACRGTRPASYLKECPPRTKQYS